MSLRKPLTVVGGDNQARAVTTVLGWWHVEVWTGDVESAKEALARGESILLCTSGVEYKVRRALIKEAARLGLAHQVVLLSASRLELDYGRRHGCKCVRVGETVDIELRRAWHLAPRPLTPAA